MGPFDGPRINKSINQKNRLNTSQFHSLRVMSSIRQSHFIQQHLKRHPKGPINAGIAARRSDSLRAAIVMGSESVGRGRWVEGLAGGIVDGSENEYTIGNSKTV